jgi:serine/threonine protein kinase
MSSASIGYFGPYRLLNVVNTGQSSRLWQAYDDQNRRFVGIKTLLDKFARQKDQIQLLKWEYDVASKFSHPKLIHIFEFDWYQKVPYLVMEWFSAPNLKMWINRGYAQYCSHLPKLLPEMVESLLYLHEQGWTHRDVKPDNFLFNSDEAAMKLIDFALTRRIAKGLGKLFAMKTKTQGTASYMSPEQIRGLPPASQADIYSLGCTFYELLTTRLPFSGESMNDLLNKHLSVPPPPITQRNKNITPEFAGIIKVMLAKKPEDRPKSTAELLKMLQTVRIFRRPPTPEDV